MLWPCHGVLGNCPVGRLAIGITTDICRYRCLIGCPSVAAPQSARAKTGRTSNEPSKEVCGSFSAFPDVGWALCHALPRSDSRLSAIPKAGGHRFVFGHA